SRIGTAVVAIVAIAGGVYVGTRWHSTFAPMLGMSAKPATGSSGSGAKDTVWTCSMHPNVIRDGPGLCPICHMQLTPVHVHAPTGGVEQPREQMPGMTGGGGRSMPQMPGMASGQP